MKKIWIRKNIASKMPTLNLPNKDSKMFQPLSEALEYKDMEGMIKPTIHVDEFSAKMGDDDDIIVISFFVRDRQAAADLADWFEKGYDWVLDADTSPGEIKPGRYLVYIEMRRRSSIGRHLQTMIEDLNTLTELEPNEWLMHYEDSETPFTVENFDRIVPLSPKEYRARRETDLNEVRIAAGLPTHRIYDQRDADLRKLQSAAGF
jgi:hypothetical protein